ncbi:MAG: aminotransferase class V-fold PLP-dependent enzyme [Planctomycetota bacterium]|nr:aminotransferase class V-fold PLP-dependent enzyme [Planctomycetota bacterium]
MLNRRSLLGALGSLPLVGERALAIGRELARTPGEPEEIARDEDFWRQVQQAFPVDRAMVNFNNGGVCPSPQIVQDSLARYTAFANEAPSYKMWRELEPQKETVRVLLARVFGVDDEEVAITRNASEGLQILQFGFDLSAGDEVLCSDQDYPRMVTTFQQRARREGIRLVQFPLPVPITDPREVVAAYESRITDRTRLILVCQVINLTGSILPVKEICALGRRRGIPVLVDGAHGFGHVPQTRDELDCDFYATSLHKWLFAPVGTGMLYVKRSRISEVWPLMAAGEGRDDDIRKFEEIGTHPCHLVLSIASAVTFLQQMGLDRKWARMLYLRDRWARRLASSDRLRLFTSLEPGLAGGIATAGIEGIPSGELSAHLWSDHKIYTIGIRHRGVDARGEALPEEAPLRIDGLRVSPAPYATLDEIDRFAEVMETAARDGLPG